MFEIKRKNETIAFHDNNNYLQNNNEITGCLKTVKEYIKFV